jgi:hypothetical protein
MSRYLTSVGFGKVNLRTLSESLLAVTLITGVYYLFSYVPKHVKAGQPVLALANYFLTYAPIERLNQPAYVIPDSVKVWDTPAEIRLQVATLQSGDQVKALGRFRNWIHVRTRDGQEGWVKAGGLMDAGTHEAEDRLREEISDMPVQARGHADDADNVHIEPSRQTAVVAEVNPEQTLEIFGRRMVRRSYKNSPLDVLRVSAKDPLEAWYLVQESSHAGWILGRRVHLDIPKSISAYAQETNLVAWLVLDIVEDNGHQLPQYLVADREGTETCDFTDIRILTWWKKKQTYAIAYKEGGLQGFFPILVSHEGSVPHFRLRLMDDAGNKYQKVYGLFETITRNMGIANTWRRDAMPEESASRPRRQRTGPSVNMRG